MHHITMASPNDPGVVIIDGKKGGHDGGTQREETDRKGRIQTAKEL